MITPNRINLYINSLVHKFPSKFAICTAYIGNAVIDLANFYHAEEINKHEATIFVVLSSSWSESPQKIMIMLEESLRFREWHNNFI